MSNEGFHEGQLQGYYECHDLTTEVIGKLRRSLEEVWSIELESPNLKTEVSTPDKLMFAINTLVHLEELFQDKYDIGLQIITSHIESLEDYDD